MTRTTRALAAAVALVLTVTLLSTAGSPATAAVPRERVAKKAFVVWDTIAINPGTGRIRAHGKVPGGKRKVLMQVKVKRSWQTIQSKRSNGKGKFKIAAKLDWYGFHKVRVIAPGRKSFSASKKVGVYPPYAPAGKANDYKFFHGSSVRKNYRFDPCRTVRYRINSDDVGPAAAELVKQAVLQASWATGIRFKYVGTSKVIPYNRRKQFGGGTDLVIGWATNAEVPDFIRRTAAGFGGPRWIYPARDARGRHSFVTTEAGVTLSTDYWKDFAPSFFDNTRTAGGMLILHEIGHALGLKHVPAYEQLMNGATYFRSPDGYWKGLYNYGDLTGLSKVGLQEGCLRKVGGRAAEVPVPEQPLD